MSEPRGPVARYYRDGDDIIRRVKDEPEQRFSLVGADLPTLRSLAAEGFVALHIRGLTATDILSGHNLPDRALPTPKMRGERKRGPTMIVRAIAAVKAAQTVKARRAGGEKVTKETVAEIETGALAWASALTEEQVKSAAKNIAVQIELAKLRGDDTPLDDLLSAPAPAATGEVGCAEMDVAA